MLNLLTSLQGKSKKSNSTNPSKEHVQTTSQPIYLRRQYSKPLPKSPINKHTTISAYYINNNQSSDIRPEYKYDHYTTNHQSAHHHTGHRNNAPLPEPKQRNHAPVIPPLYFEQETPNQNQLRANYPEVNAPSRSKSMYFTSSAVDNYYTSPPLPHKMPSQSHTRQNSTGTDIYAPSYHSGTSISSIQPQPNQKIFPSHQNQHTPLSMHPNRHLLNNSKSPLLNKKLSQYKSVADEPQSRPLPRPIVRHDSAPTRQPMASIEPQRSKSTSVQNNMSDDTPVENTRPLSSMKSFAQLQQHHISHEEPAPSSFKSFYQMRKEKLSMPDLKSVAAFENTNVKNRPLPKTPIKPNTVKSAYSAPVHQKANDVANSNPETPQKVADPWFKNLSESPELPASSYKNPSQRLPNMGEDMSRESSVQSSLLSYPYKESDILNRSNTAGNQKIDSLYTSRASAPNNAFNNPQAMSRANTTSDSDTSSIATSDRRSSTNTLSILSSMPVSSSTPSHSGKVQAKESVNELRSKFEMKIEQAGQPNPSQQLPNTVKEILRRPKTMFLPRTPVDVSDGMPSIAATLDPEGSAVKPLDLENLPNLSNKVDPEKLEEIKTTEMMIKKLSRSRSNAGISGSPPERRNHWPVKDEGDLKSPDVGKSLTSPKWKSFSNLAREASDSASKMINTYNTIQSPEISPKPMSKMNKLFRRSSLWSPKSERADSPPNLNSSSSESADISLQLELTKLRSQLEKTQTELRNERQLHTNTHETYQNKTKMLEDLHEKDLKDLKAVCSKQCRDLVQSIKELERANKTMRQNMQKHGLQVNGSTPKISNIDGVSSSSIEFSSNGSQLSSLSDSKISIQNGSPRSTNGSELPEDSDNLATYAFIEQQYRQIMGNTHPDFNKTSKASGSESSPHFIKMETSYSNSSSSSPEQHDMKMNPNANSIVSSRRGSLGASPALSYARRMSIVNSINTLNSSISPPVSNNDKSNNLKSKSRLLAPSLLQVTPKMQAVQLESSSPAKTLPMTLPNSSNLSVDTHSTNNKTTDVYHNIKQVIPGPNELDIEPPLTFYPLKVKTNGNLWNSRSLKEKMLPELPTQ
ncbi:hypothetical protein CONCODRAFT_2460 [Conidiobolus coronatus NRRL 28638]|uniref:Uncharacterized protein n=1 Tax=Conidiobolus coronatus (strain ATCC 28846 / CBS 209.66 / NRRL 28638) TaxID=796925 RepID=A0A137PHP6_CONC2|nr:hypothetical protein CONCODRAFT_2460 [Conidiobolus coronatus NRRL 28638]|eukprot:KXN74451.1 hypothetical protein CONCODRAFT_2460 [Conidiobolus coronatus NRRL 28638]